MVRASLVLAGCVTASLVVPSSSPASVHDPDPLTRPVLGSGRASILDAPADGRVPASGAGHVLYANEHLLDVDALLAQRVIGDGKKSPDDEKKTAEEDEPESPRSPWLAMGLSAALPGAGQFYVNRGNLLSFVYAGVEVLSWYLRSAWEQDGDEKTEEFEQFAWQGKLDDTEGAPLNEILREEGNWSWERWRAAYRGEDVPEGCVLVERANAETDSMLVDFYFHNPREFYEDIGKYDKYQCGWFSPELRTRYRSMRAEANDLLQQSRSMKQVILLNHLVSSVHAFFQAKGHNKRIEAADSDLRLDFEPDVDGGLRANLVYRRQLF